MLVEASGDAAGRDLEIPDARGELCQQQTDELSYEW